MEGGGGLKREGDRQLDRDSETETEGQRHR